MLAMTKILSGTDKGLRADVHRLVIVCNKAASIPESRARLPVSLPTMPEPKPEQTGVATANPVNSYPLSQATPPTAEAIHRPGLPELIAGM